MGGCIASLMGYALRDILFGFFGLFIWIITGLGLGLQDRFGGNLGECTGL